MKVLVLGARGRTGRLVVAELQRRGHEPNATLVDVLEQGLYLRQAPLVAGR